MTCLLVFIPKSRPYLACTFPFRRVGTVSATTCLSPEAHVWHREPSTLAHGLTRLLRLGALPEEGRGSGRAVRLELPPHVLFLPGSFTPWLPASESRTPPQGHFRGGGGGGEVSSHPGSCQEVLWPSQEHLLAGQTANASL